MACLPGITDPEACLQTTSVLFADSWRQEGNSWDCDVATWSEYDVKEAHIQEMEKYHPSAMSIIACIPLQLSLLDGLDNIQVHLEKGLTAL